MSLTSYEPDRELVRNPVPLPIEGALPQWVALLGPVAELAERLAGTEFVPKAIRNSPASIAAVILAGQENGLGPMTALSGIDVIEGTPTPSAELLRGMILAAGHEIWPVEATSTRATVAGRRRGETREHSVTWTTEDAKRANLLGKFSWRAYPRAMLLARATAELARQVFPDATRGLTGDPDLRAVEENTPPEVETSEPETTTVARRKPGRPRKSAQPQERPAEALERPEELASPVTPQPEPGSSGSTQNAAQEPEAQSAEPASSTPAEPASSTTEEPADPGMSSDQRARMNATFRDLSIDTRPDRLAVVISIIGRTIDSSADMTAHEASLVISRLDRARDGSEPLPPIDEL